MKIATTNVNGIRAAMRKGIGEWIESTGPDVILMQEVRASDDIVDDLLGSSGYTIFNEASQMKGRAGVAVAVREGIKVGEVRRGLSEEEIPVDSGRWLEVPLPGAGLRVISAYLHSGVASKPEKMEAKYAHLERVSSRLKELDQAEKILVAGDFNIVHTERDIENWKPNHNKTSGVLDDEIAYLDRWFGEGWVDTQRQLDDAAGREGKGPYTWWSQRGRAFENNVGWRIDYQMTTPPLAALATDYRIDRAENREARWSDHAPVTVTYNI